MGFQLPFSQLVFTSNFCSHSILKYKNQPYVDKYTWMVWVWDKSLKLLCCLFSAYFNSDMCFIHFFGNPVIFQLFIAGNCASKCSSLTIEASGGWRGLKVDEVSRPRKMLTGVGFFGAWNCQTKVDHFLGLSCEFLFVFFWGGGRFGTSY